MQDKLTALIEAMLAGNNLGAYHATIGALDRLKMAYSGKEAEVVDSCINMLFSLKDMGGASIPYTGHEQIAHERRKVLNLAKNDPRLKTLFG